ncbi:MAG: hypothetical protein K5839_06575 [Treponemataceae bacterium]|nr:hypothetical protein [Treponemataceae bacterium]
MYTEKNVRLTDMYQEAGRAILGWEGGKARLVFKNTLERGQTGSFTTHFDHQLEKAVTELFPGFNFIRICYQNQAEKASVFQWRPWISDLSDKEIFYFIPPFPFACDYVILAAKKEESFSFLDQKLLIPPVLTAAFTRSIYDLSAALTLRSEDDFRYFDKSLLRYFDRKGPYLFPKIERKDYQDFILFCLDHKIVISPDYEIPSIIPFGADYGVFRSFSRADFGGGK